MTTRYAQPDPLSRAANWTDGLRASFVGICGNESLATGVPVDVTEFLGIDRRTADAGSSA